MPRSQRRPTVGPEADALDAAARALDEAEAVVERLRQELIAKMIEAVRAGMPKAEAGRRAGYSREHASKLVSDAERAGVAGPYSHLFEK